MAFPPLHEMLTNQILDLPCEEQHAAAQKIAGNIGYKLVPEDQIQDEEDKADMLKELRRLYELHGHQTTADVIAKATGNSV